MNCADYQNAMQRRLDGEGRLETFVEDQHLALCSECRRWSVAAERLQSALNRSNLPRPPVGLAGRIATHAIQERKRRVVVRRFTGVAIAASLALIAIFGYGSGWFGGGASSPARIEIAKPEPPADAVPSLRTNVEDAVVAIRELVNQTTDKALEPGRILFPDRAAVAFITESAALQTPTPTIPSLRRASQGVTEFAPVAGFGRFINYFAQDIPGIEGERKSRL